MLKRSIDRDVDGIGSGPQVGAVQSPSDRDVEGRVSSKEFSPELLLLLGAHAREYAARHGNPFDWFGLERISSQKNPPVETCPYCVKGITDQDTECEFCMGQGRLT
jgi:hypothetical protein